MTYTVRARYGSQELDVREFVLPRGWMVAEVLASVGVHELESSIWHCWDWVCREIEYPPLPLATVDYHKEEAFLKRGPLPWSVTPIKRSTKWDFWQLPWETIDHQIGDCEDSSILLASLLRNLLTAGEVYVTIGIFSGYCHGWVTLVKGATRYVLESTLDKAFAGSPYQVLEADPYWPLLYFNDEQAFESYEGAFEELKQVLRQEEVKLPLIRHIYQQAVVDKEKIPGLS